MEYRRVEDSSSDVEDSDTHTITEISLIDSQAEILKQIFSFGQPTNEDDDDPSFEVGDRQKVPRTLFTFKALVYDQHGQNLIAPVMKIGNLLDCNIIHHANIDSKREPLPDLPVIYLVEPTLSNFKLIAKDARDKLYDMMIVNFTKPLESLKPFADEMQLSRQAHRVISVSSECIGGFQSITPKFFTWPQYDHSITPFTEGRLANSVYIDMLAQNIYCLNQSLNLGAPIMRVAGDFMTKLSVKLTSVYKQTPQGKPFLFIPLTRSDDMNTPLYHSWQYLSLIKDIFKINNNAFVFKEDEKAAPQNFEICMKTDDILKENAYTGFDEAAPNVDKALNQWKTEYETLNAKRANLSEFSTGLTSAIDAIPKMTEKKRKIDMHVSLATKILQEIKMREIDKLQDFEEEAMRGQLSTATRQSILAYVQQQTQDEVQKTDRLRLSAILIQSCQDLRFVAQVFNLVKPILSEQQVQLLQSLTDKQALLRAAQGPQNSSLLNAVGASLLEKVGVLSKDKKLVMVNQVKEIIQTAARKVPINTIAQSSYYINCATGQKCNSLATLPQTVVVFTMGGGTFIEHELMQALGVEMKRTHKVEVVYGCDRVVSPTESVQLL